jgi:hypothetical protein
MHVSLQTRDRQGGLQTKERIDQTQPDTDVTEHVINF